MNAPVLEYIRALTSWLVEVVSTVYETTKLPTESTATLESDSCRKVGVTRNELLTPPRLTPAIVNRAARMSVSPVESLRVQVTTKLPAPSMATAGSESSVLDVLLMMISLPMGCPEELYRRALMSLSVLEMNLVQTTTDRPLT